MVDGFGMLLCDCYVEGFGAVFGLRVSIELQVPREKLDGGMIPRGREF